MSVKFKRRLNTFGNIMYLTEHEDTVELVKYDLLSCFEEALGIFLKIDCDVKFVKICCSTLFSEAECRFEVMYPIVHRNMG